MNMLAHNLVIQMRMFKRARDKVATAAAAKTTTPGPNLASAASSHHLVEAASIAALTSPSSFAHAKSVAAAHELSLVDTFFELEAEIEKGVCRDLITVHASDRERDFLRELGETMCFALLTPRVFACLPLRCLLRELIVTFLLGTSIESVTEPDFINQCLLYLVIQKPNSQLACLSVSVSLFI